ncbi:MAG: sensor histidine kinase [Phycicoccus sp.]
MLAPIIGCAVALVAALAVPALLAISRDRTQELVLDRSTALSRFAVLARSGIDSGDTTALEQHAHTYLALYGEPVLVVDPGGRVIVRAPGLRPDDPAVAAAVTAARRNQPVDTIAPAYPWSPTEHLLAQPVVGTGDLTGGAVVMRVDAGRAVADVRARWAVALTMAAAGLALLTALGLLLGRWILRPVRELDAASQALAAGRLPQGFRHTGPPELRRLAESFDVMTTSVTATIRERGRLVGDFSHRLRNPLTAVRLRVDALRQEETAPRVDRSLAEVDRDLDRLDRMLRTMLDLAEAEHRAASEAVRELLHPDERPLDLSCELFAEEVVSRWAGPAAARDVAVAASGAEHLSLRCSAMDVHDMVDELVENAIRHAGGGAEVTVRLGLRGGPGSGPVAGARVGVVEVADTGRGLRPEELERAVERFWRADTGDPTEGTGLGLAIVARLAEANGGGLDVRSNLPRGLVVTLTLPAAPDR